MNCELPGNELCIAASRAAGVAFPEASSPPCTVAQHTCSENRSTPLHLQCFPKFPQMRRRRRFSYIFIYIKKSSTVAAAKISSKIARVAPDGIQRKEIGPARRTRTDARRRRAQDHHSHPLESSGGSERQPPHHHGHRSGTQHPHLLRRQGKKGRRWHHPRQKTFRATAPAPRRRSEIQAPGKSLGAHHQRSPQLQTRRHVER